MMGSGPAELARELASTAGRWRGGVVWGSWSRVGRRGVGGAELAIEKGSVAY